MHFWAQVPYSSISECLDRAETRLTCVCVLHKVGPVHYSRDLQVLFSAKTTLKLGLMVLFTHLKIILLQYFQFPVFSNKWYLNRPFVSIIISSVSNSTPPFAPRYLPILKKKNCLSDLII